AVIFALPWAVALGSPGPMSLMRRALASLALFLAYLGAAKAGLLLASINPSASAVWPPTGIAITACLFMGRDALPPIFAAAFVANITTAGSIATSLAIAAGNSAEAALGGYVITRFAGGRSGLTRAPDVFRFAGFAALGAAAVSATVGVTALALGGYAPWQNYLSIWLTWWLGDASG